MCVVADRHHLLLLYTVSEPADFNLKFANEFAKSAASARPDQISVSLDECLSVSDRI